MRMKDKFYKGVVKPTMLYGLECGGKQENKADNECSWEENIEMDECGEKRI